MTMTKALTPNIPNLTRLAEVLFALPQGWKIDLDTYATAGEGVGTHACGTTVCAIGYGALDPVLMKRGLRMTGPDDILIKSVAHFNAVVKANPGSDFGIKIKGQTSFAPGVTDAAFFGIDSIAWNAHFQDCGYGHLKGKPTARDVAMKLNKTFKLGLKAPRKSRAKAVEIAA
ncbi:hypothetical protein [Roseococcus pinisoli]|uniref:Uncharacterized protein n=1 Tax=Roseococcus pinisoli TaxID=2835040 RepID=A0ABS5QFD9_9PROT|nr:hypothetical protein [Roseococcus pinisoli]MBS7812391.1 hypothetical protein [Roseococcus pinisoli]